MPQCIDTLMGKVHYLVLTFLYGGELEDRAVQVRIQSVLNRLLPLACLSKEKLKCQIAVIDTEVQKMMCLSEDRIVVSKGFIDSVDVIDLSEDTGVTKDDVLAAALGHQIGHALTNRSLPPINFLFLSWITFVLAWGIEMMIYSDDPDMSSKGRCLIVIALLFTSLFFLDGWQENEYEIDQYAIHLMHRAHYNLRGSLVLLRQHQSLFERLNFSKKIVATFFEKRNLC